MIRGTCHRHCGIYDGARLLLAVPCTYPNPNPIPLPPTDPERYLDRCPSWLHAQENTGGEAAFREGSDWETGDEGEGDGAGDDVEQDDDDDDET